MLRRAPLGLLCVLAMLALIGDAQLAATLAPALLVAALPLLGLFPGERLIVARRTRSRMHLRPVRARWGRPPAEFLGAFALERSPLCRRGPPVVA